MLVRTAGVLFTWLLVVTELSACGPSKPVGQASYYVAIFATVKSQLYSRINDTHSYATFVRVVHACEPSRPIQVESFTISWMPKSLRVNAWSRYPEPGINLDLAATLKWADDNRLKNCLWGPYQTTAALYERAARQREYLESEALLYKTVTTGWNRYLVSNCIYALTDVVITPPSTRYDVVGAGCLASYWIAWFYRRHLIEPRVRHDWLLPYLGLADRKFIRKAAPLHLPWLYRIPATLPD